MLKVLKFQAIWCSPCKQLTPVVKEIKSELNNFELKEVDVDDFKNNDIVKEYQVRNIPTLIFEKDGEIVEKLVGVHSKEKIIQTINKYV